MSANRLNFGDDTDPTPYATGPPLANRNVTTEQDVRHLTGNAPFNFERTYEPSVRLQPKAFQPGQPEAQKGLEGNLDKASMHSGVMHGQTSTQQSSHTDNYTAQHGQGYGHGFSDKNESLPPIPNSSAIADTKPPTTDFGISAQNITGVQGSNKNAANQQSTNQGTSTQKQADTEGDAGGKEGSQPASEPATGYGSAIIQNAQDTLNQLKQSIGGAMPSGTRIGDVGQAGVDKIAQASSSAIRMLDEQGINANSSKQKLDEFGQVLKDYGTLGQESTAEYLQQAVDSAHAIGTDKKNRSIVANVLGAVALVWLAFGFSLKALIALGIIVATTAILSQYSGSRSHQSFQPSKEGCNLAAKDFSRAPDREVETHYPRHQRGTHPDASINTL